MCDGIIPAVPECLTVSLLVYNKQRCICCCTPVWQAEDADPTASSSLCLLACVIADSRGKKG